MLTAARNLVPPNLRRKLITGVPRVVRHRMIDYYSAMSQNLARVNPLTAPDPPSFWRNASLEHETNSPISYAQREQVSDVMLVKEYAQRLAPGSRVLDFGCNAGRALHHFAESGFQVVGVDINPEAVALGKRTFPSLAAAEFHVGDGEKVLAGIPNDYVDFAYTLAVLRHVQPNSIETICREISRISRRYICTLEDEASHSALTFPRNYGHIFSRLGWKQIEQEYLIDTVPNGEWGIGTILRILSK